MTLDKIDITTRTVLFEKTPFYVSIFSPSGVFCGKYLVRQCVSEDDLSKARLEYENIRLRYRRQGRKSEVHNLSNPMLYYLIMSDDGNSGFVGDIVSKNICQKIKK
jgi:hypothetical protein